MNNIINYIYMSCENNNVDLIKLTKNELLAYEKLKLKWKEIPVEVIHI